MRFIKDIYSSQSFLLFMFVIRKITNYKCSTIDPFNINIRFTA